MEEVASDGFTFLTTYKPNMPTSKEQGLYFLSGKMQGTKRNDQSLLEKNLIALDYDALSSDFTPETFYNALIEKIGNYSFMAYPTISHTIETPKYRVIIPLQSPINNKETYKDAVTYLTNCIGLEHDSSAKKWSQLQGMPVHENMNMIHVTPLKFEYDAQILMVDRWAQRNRSKLVEYSFYLNAHMVLTRAVVAQELTQVQAETCVTILSNNNPEQIENNIQKIRTEIKSAQRLDDPLSYFRLNASIIEFFEGLPPTVQGTETNWISALKRSDNGYYFKTIPNLKAILINDPALKDLFMYNEFSGEIEKGAVAPWDRYFMKQLSDNDLSKMRVYIAETWGIEYGKDTLLDVLQDVAELSSYHPIKSMIELSPWDGVPRAETIFSDYLGANNDLYMRTVARKWLAGAVARIYNPGVKFEIVPVITGKQGRGKSTLAQKLGGDHFRDDLANLKSKDAKEFLKGSWIIELSELSAMRRTEMDEVKAFLSSTTDRYRPSYGRITVDIPRTCVFIGTSNDSEFLKDVTGNRRFYPIPIGQAPEKDVFTLDKDTVQQIWAEAYTFYQAGEELFVSKEIEALAENYRSDAESEDPIKTSIYQYLEILLPEDWETYNNERKRLYIQEIMNNDYQHKGTVQRVRVTTREISSELFCVDTGEELRGRSMTKNISNIMNNNPDWNRKQFRIEGMNTKGYERANKA